MERLKEAFLPQYMKHFLMFLVWLTAVLSAGILIGFFNSPIHTMVVLLSIPGFLAVHGSCRLAANLLDHRMYLIRVYESLCTMFIVLSLFLDSHTQTFFVCLSALMTFSIMVEYFFIFEQQKSIFNDRYLEQIKEKLTNMAKEKPCIKTTCKVWQKEYCGARNFLLGETEKCFKYDHWIDTTDLSDIYEKIAASIAVLVKLQVGFGNPETEQAFKDHLEQFPRETLDNYGGGNDLKAEVCSTFKFGAVENEKLIVCDTHYLYYLQGLQWPIKILFQMRNQLSYRVETITIRKIVTIIRKEAGVSYGESGGTNGDSGVNYDENSAYHGNEGVITEDYFKEEEEDVFNKEEDIIKVEASVDVVEDTQELSVESIHDDADSIDSMDSSAVTSLLNDLGVY